MKQFISNGTFTSFLILFKNSIQTIFTPPLIVIAIIYWVITYILQTSFLIYSWLSDDILLPTVNSIWFIFLHFTIILLLTQITQNKLTINSIKSTSVIYVKVLLYSLPYYIFPLYLLQFGIVGQDLRILHFLLWVWTLLASSYVFLCTSHCTTHNASVKESMKKSLQLLRADWCNIAIKYILPLTVGISVISYYIWQWYNRILTPTYSYIPDEYFITLVSVLMTTLWILYFWIIAVWTSILYKEHNQNNSE